MTAADLESFGFDPIVNNDLGDPDNLGLHLVPMDELADIDLGSFDDFINEVSDEHEEQLEEEEHEEDDHKIQDHYIKLLASDYRRSKRAKQDRDDRASIRKNFEVLSALSHRVQMDHSIDVVDNDDLCRPSDSFRCRDSNLRTLRKATKTLQELIKISRQLKKEKREIKAKLKKQQMKAKHTRKIKRHVKRMDTEKKKFLQGHNVPRFFNTPRSQPFMMPPMYSPYPQQATQLESVNPFYRNLSMRMPQSNGYKILPPSVYSNAQIPSKSFLYTSNNNIMKTHDINLIDRYIKPCHVISM